jgi:hypothetical protein
MRIILKSQPLEAWQYLKNVKVPMWVIAITEWPDTGLLLVRQSGKQVINLGEWLVIDADNEVVHMTDAYVKRFYEVVG